MMAHLNLIGYSKTNCRYPYSASLFRGAELLND